MTSVWRGMIILKNDMLQGSNLPKNVCGRKRRERITEKKERQQLTLTVSGGEKGPWGERMHVFQPDKSGTN